MSVRNLSLRGVSARLILLSSLLLSAVAPRLHAQPTSPDSASTGSTPVGSAAGRPGAARTGAAATLRAFFDCQAFFCREFDYVRAEIPWANWMRDRFDSEVHVLVTGTRNGAGGLDITVTNIGRGPWAGQIDTLRVSTLPNDADDVVRRKMVQFIRLGLVRFAVQTPLASRLNVNVVGPQIVTATPEATNDPWNFWVYTIGVTGAANLESRQDEERLGVNLAATRVTGDWRLGFGANGSYRGRAFELSASQPRSVFVNRTYDATAYAVRSLDSRWSTGVLANVGYSDFLNEDLLVRVQPAIEYNVFPWSEVVRRQLSVMYAAGPVYYEWQRPTIFGVQRRETRPQHKAIVSFGQRQTWGNVTGVLQGQQYLDDLAKYSVSLALFTNFRIGKGLQFNVTAQISQVRDQIYLAAGGLTEQQILVQQQALATDYTARLNLGMSYTFGSIYNTVVNRRLDALLGFGRGLSNQQ
jgi:hypothetical protein